MKKVVPSDAILIPPEARSVFKGEIFEVFQWPQQLYDGSTKTFEMLRRPDSVDILLIEDDKVLILKDEQPNRPAILSLPSGRVERGESWLAAAKRELKEEAGISCNDWKLIEVQQPVHKMEWFIGVYVASEITEQSQQKLDAGEKIEFGWRNYRELRQAIFDGSEPDLEYLLPLLRKADSTAALLAMQQFAGNEIDA